MESLHLALSTVFPLVVYMLVGQFIKHYNILKPDSLKEMNDMIFKILIPISLFNDISKATFSDVEKPWAFIYVAAAILVVYLISWKAVAPVVKDKADASVLVQGIYRSNHVLFGSVIAANLCTPEGIHISAAMIAMVVPLYNVLVVILFELNMKGRVRIPELIKSIFKNPLIRASIIGFAANLLRIRLPEMITIPVEKLAACASPIALVTLGAMINIDSIKAHKAYIITVSFLRLVAVPGIVILIGVLAGLRGDYVAILISVFASPAAASSAATAHAMGANGELAAELVAVTTVACVATLFLFIFTLSGTGTI